MFTRLPPRKSQPRAPDRGDIAVRGCAISGSVILRVGDNVATHQNSQIVADNNIFIYGDFHFTDPDGNELAVWSEKQ